MPALILLCFRVGAQPTPETGGLEGRTINSVSGEPVRRAQLTLQAAGAEAVFHTVSGPDGSFSFESVPPGSYRLSAERTGYVEREFGSRSAFGSGARLDVNASQSVKGIEFKLTPQAVISGRVFDSDHDPVANTSVLAFRRIGNGVVRKFIRVDSADTNDLGEFRISGLPAGTYVLAADSPPALPGLQNGATYYPGTTDLSGAAEIPVTAGQECSGNDIQLRKVRLYSIRGRVTGSARNLQLMLLPANPAEASLGLQRASAVPTLDGSFKMSGVSAGVYQLIAVRTDGPGRVVGVVRAEVNGADLDGVQLIAGDPAALTGRLRIEGDRNQLLPAMSILLLPEGVPTLPSIGRVSRDGGIRAEGVSPILYRVNFSALPPEAFVKSATAAGKDILENGLDLRDGALPPLDVTISMKAAIVSGAVREEGKPAPGSLVVLLPEDTSRDILRYRKTAAAENGEFTLTGLPPGSYRLWAFPEGTEIDPYLDADFIRSGERIPVKVTVAESARERIDLKL